MDLEKSSKHERNALRREKEILKQAKQSDYIRTLMNDMEEKPEEVMLFWVLNHNDLMSLCNDLFWLLTTLRR